MRYAEIEGHGGKSSKIQTSQAQKNHKNSKFNKQTEQGQDGFLRQFVKGLVLPVRLVLGHWKLFGTCVLVLGISLFGWYGYQTFRSLGGKVSDLGNVPQAAVNLVKKGPQLQNKDGRTNILLLGIGGEGHDGPYLTDSMMVASINLESADAVLISLPRDIWVPSARAKVNAVYAYARLKAVENGLPATRTAVEEMLGLPIHYAVRVDFGGFKRAIDLMGGVEVEVARAFVDSEYPIDGNEKAMCGLIEVVVTPAPVASTPPDGSPAVSGGLKSITNSQNEIRFVDTQGVDRTDDPRAFACRYETLKFEVGKEVMDGTRALKFVRSRHGNNDEGSDFARADRQQRVIEAFKSKVLSAGTLLNPARMTSLIEEFGKSIETDIKVSDYGEFAKLAQSSTEGEIKTHTVTGEGTDALLVVPPSREPYGGAYVLIPKNGDWSVVHAKVQDWLMGVEPSPEPTASIRPSLTPLVR